MKFSTFDRDNDRWPNNCASSFHGAWWYNACHASNLNEEYNNTQYAQGVGFSTWTGHYYSLKFSEMKLRPANFSDCVLNAADA